MAYLPPENSSDMLSLISVLSDPNAAKARLKEIRDATDALNTSVYESRQAVEQVDRKTAELAESYRKLNEEKALFETDADKFNNYKTSVLKDIEDLRTSAFSKATLAEHWSNQLEDKSQQLDAKSSELQVREDKLKDREDAVYLREQDIFAKEKDYEERFNRLKEIVA